MQMKTSVTLLGRGKQHVLLTPSFHQEFMNTPFWSKGKSKLAFKRKDIVIHLCFVLTVSPPPSSPKKKEEETELGNLKS